MSENNKSKNKESEDSESDSVLGCLGAIAGLAGLAATLALGPIDFTRTVYNQIIGDAPVLKRQLVNYCREQVKESYSKNQKTKAELEDLDNAVETILAGHLSVPYNGQGKINPNDASIGTLWDYIEDRPKS